MKKISILLVFALFMSVIACKKKNTDPAPNPNMKGSVEVEFDNFVGTQEFRLGTTYTNPNTNESFTPSMLRYFISNISLKTTAGVTYTVPQEQSYFLLDIEDPNSMKFILNDVPEGDYNEITFMIGVDSLRNTKPVEQRTGNLDIAGKAQGMYWSWNSGYIFVKMEGTSPQSTAVDNKFRYHIGGFGGYSSTTINCIRMRTLSFGTTAAKVRANKTPTIHLMADWLKLFNGSTQLRIANNHTVMFNPFGVNIANNYVEAFSFDHVHN
ncbi:MAG: MbnP family protein [Raineya sp.]